MVFDEIVLPILIDLFVLVPLIVGAAMYNKIVKWENRVKESWADIDVQLKRRQDLIPNLLETVKGYANFEKTVLQELTQARTQANQAFGAMQTYNAEMQVNSALQRFMAVAESYPDLKAADSFVKFQAELSNTENRLAAAREFYNSNVTEFNNIIEKFPSNIIAKIFQIKTREFFRLQTITEKNPINVKI